MGVKVCKLRSKLQLLFWTFETVEQGEAKGNEEEEEDQNQEHI